MRREAKEAERRSLMARLRESLRREVRQQLTQEFIQSGLVRITGQDHVNALIAGRNEWRGNKLLDELAQDFAAAGNPEAASAIREWQRRTRQASVRRRSGNSQETQHQAEASPLPLPGPALK
jgi:hypothetical protein